MKKLLLALAGWLAIAAAQAQPDRLPYFLQFTTQQHASVTGTLPVQLTLSVTDTLTHADTLYFYAGDGFFTSSPAYVVAGTNLAPGDSLQLTLNLTYNTAALPYYPATKPTMPSTTGAPKSSVTPAP